MKRFHTRKQQVRFTHPIGCRSRNDRHGQHGAWLRREIVLFYRSLIEGGAA